MPIETWELDPDFTRERLDRILEASGVPSTMPSPELSAVSQTVASTPGGKVREREMPTTPTKAYGEIDSDDKHADLTLQKAEGRKAGEDVDYVEEVIRIIMNATGYDRDEIEPEMDIRQDLAIRSSRLPVIMDDVLVNFDDDRRRSAVDVISDFARDRQVIFFTCHQATVEAFATAAKQHTLLEMPTFKRSRF